MARPDVPKESLSWLGRCCRGPMPTTVAVGCQFGDEGKGKIIDFLAADADVVVRFQGGANAGHTVQVGDELYAFHLLPSGVLRNRTMNVIGNGVVIDPDQLLKEIDETRARGHPVKNLRISDRAHVVMPYHKVLDGLEEKLKGGLAAAVGAGVGPQHLTDILGVAKAFTSRVGAGPFPTELEGPIAEHLRERGGGEYGTTTRRPRRVGWFDLVMLRMAVRVNGLTRLALTKLDVLGGLERVRVCIGYRHDGGVLREFPASMRVLADCAPMYREFPGWPDLPEEEWIRIATRGRRALPETTRRYVAFVESQLKVPVLVLSVGRSRAATMGACLRSNPGSAA